MALLSFYLWLLLSLIAAPAAIAANVTTKSIKDCRCGFYDATTKHLYTQALIVYFNETESFPNGTFMSEKFEHQYEKGWNHQFRIGATPDNVKINNSALQLYIDPTTKDHLVVGGSVRTERRDMQYGTFRSYMHSPYAWAPGSALSMMIKFNETESMEIDLMNTNEPSQAWASTLVGADFPDRELGVNYTSWSNKSGTLWDYSEYRIDWSKKGINFFIDGNMTRSATKKSRGYVPETPSPLFFQHWSTGNFFSTQGPPSIRASAPIGWTRLFFNASTISEEDREMFDSNCHVSDACSVDDHTLRGASPYSSDAESKFTIKEKQWSKRWVPIMISCISIGLSSFLLLHTFFRRVTTKAPVETPAPEQASQLEELGRLPSSAVWIPDNVELLADEALPPAGTPGSRTPGDMTPGNYTPAFRSAAPSVASRKEFLIRMSTVSRPQSVNDTGDEKDYFQYRRTKFNEGIDDFVGSSSSSTVMSPPEGKLHGTPTLLVTPSNPSTPLPTRPPTALSRPTSRQPEVDDMEITPAPPIGKVEDVRLSMEVTKRRHTSSETTTDSRDSSNETKSVVLGNDVSSLPAVEKTGSIVIEKPLTSSKDALNLPAIEKTASVVAEKPVASPAQPPAAGGPPAPKKRVDYLAGLVAVSSLLVTAIHYALTFVPAAINPGAFAHYQSETWARKTIDSYFLNLIWIGPFLMTSTRFLVTSYLRTGKLDPVAERVVGRTFRLMVPITCVVLLEYFLMDIGATSWLQYLASVTWSTWPFTVVYSSFGNLLSEILQLMFLIPNAAPQITFNYCTGVLWTIPVQLQGSWQTLLSVFMIREMKTPWKRFSFYAFCIGVHWYALSWGTYFYFGILLTDLDITYKWRKWLDSHRLILYPLIFISGAAGIGGLAIDMVTQWTNVNYSTYEYGVHPDIPTGLPISQTGAAGYPQYYVPKLNGLVFSVGFQVVVELSPLAQKLLSFKLLQYVFPHIFTIYLIHGFVFWSLGAYLCIHLSASGIPYWLNMLITATCCYGAIGLSVPILTTVIETLGQKITKDIWRSAHQVVAPRLPTLYPFSMDLLEARNKSPDEKGLVDTDVEKG